MWRIRSCWVDGLEDSAAQVELVRLVNACLLLLRGHRESGGAPKLAPHDSLGNYNCACSKQTVYPSQYLVNNMITRKIRDRHCARARS
jgi:hypothetical protein